MTTYQEFGRETGALEVTQAFAGQIKGKTVVVTGVSPNSIGKGVCVAVAAHQPKILILVSKTQSKLAEVAAGIQKVYPEVNIKTVIVDLLSQKSIRQAADQINRLTNTIDVLVNNAGLMAQKRVTTEEGIEGQFAANHIGPFLLTNLLIDKLRAATKDSASGSVRIINTSSLGHRLSGVRFHDYNLEGKEIPDEEKSSFPLSGAFAKEIDGYNGFVAYGQSKSANILFTVALTEHLKANGILSFALHPGSIWTNLSRDLDPEGYEAIGKTSPFWKNIDQGAATTCVAAFDPALDGSKGLFLSDCQLIEAAAHATDPVISQKLWDLSEKLVGQEFNLEV